MCGGRARDRGQLRGGRAARRCLHGAAAGRRPKPKPNPNPNPNPNQVAPCVEDVCVYEERLAVGWRALVNHPVAFPFGHGLSYTRFAYTWLATPQRHAASGEVRLAL